MSDEATFLKSLYASGWWAKAEQHDDLDMTYTVSEMRGVSPFLWAVFEMSGTLITWSNHGTPQTRDMPTLLAYMEEKRYGS